METLTLLNVLPENPTFLPFFKIKHLLPILILCLGNLTAQAKFIDDGLGRFPSQVFTPSEMGLSNNTWCGKIVQGKYGKIYVQTNIGVAIYNGTQWKMLPFPDSDFVYDLYALPSGKLLISTQNRIHIFDESNEVLTPVTLENGLDLGKRITFYRDYDTHTHSLHAVSAAGYNKINVTNAQVSKISNPTPLAELCFALNIHYDRELPFFLNADKVPSKLPDIPDLRLLVPSSTTPTILHGFTRWGEMVILDMSNYPDEISQKNSISLGNNDCTTKDVLRIDANRIALATEKHGLLIINNDGKTIRSIKSENSCLPANGCSNLCLDEQNGLWVSTWNGVARFQVDSPITYFDKEYGLSAYVRDVYFDEQNLLFGISAGFLTIERDASGINKLTEHSPHRRQIWNILNIDSDIFTLSRSSLIKELFQTNQNKLVIKGSKEAEFAPQLSLLYLVQDDLSVYYHHEGALEPILEEHPLNNSYYKTDLSHSQNLWMTSNKGEIHYLKVNEWLEFKDSSVPEVLTVPGLPNNKSNTLEVGSKNILVASGNRIYEIDETTLQSRKLNLPELESLPIETQTLRLSYINDSRFFLETVHEGEPSHIIFDAEKNVQPSSDYNYLFMLDGYRYVISEKDTLGNLWCFGAAGAAKVDLSKPQWSQPTEKVQIDTIIIGDQEINTRLKGSDINLGAYNYTLNDIEITAYLPSFLPKYNTQKNNLFRFELVPEQTRIEENYDGKWTADNLRHGSYTLTISATDAINRGLQPVTVKFQILAPWYRSIWAIVFYVLLGVAISTLITVIFLRIQSDRLWKERIEMERRLKTEAASKEAQLRALQLQINPHFLFNSLNFISNSLKENPSVKESVDRLAAFLRHALEDKNSGMIALEEEIKSIHQYIAIEHRKSTNPFDVTFDISPDTTRIKLPGLITQPIVENALKYADTDDDGIKRIHISSNIQDSKLIISVFNTGQWRDKLDEQTPIGLKNVTQRIKLEYGNDGALTWDNLPEQNLVVVKLILSCS